MISFVIRWTLRLVFLPVVLGLALWVSADFHLSMPLTQHAFKDTIEAFVSSKIKGELQIGHFDHIGEQVLHAHDVRLWDPVGQRVLHFELIEIEIEMHIEWPLRMHVHAAHAHGGSVKLRTAPSGAPNLLWALETVEEGDTEDIHPYLRRLLDFVRSDAPFRVDGIELHDIEITGELLGLKNIHAVDVTARGQLIAGATLEVQLSDAHMTLERPFDFHARIDGMHGTFSSDPRRAVLIYATAHRGDERVHVQVAYGTPTGAAAPELELTVDASPLSSDTLQALGYAWAGPLNTSMVGSFQMAGPLDDMTMSANIMADGGPAVMTGSISARRGTNVTIKTEGLALDAVLGDGPDMVVKGELHIQAQGDEPPTLRATIEPTVFGGIVVPSFDVEGVLTDEAFEITSLSARQKGAKMTGHGTIGLDGATNLQISAHIPNIAADPNLHRLVPNARGAIDAELHVITPPAGGKRLDIRGRVVLRNLRYGMLRADRIVLDGSARGDPELPALNLKVTGKNLVVDEYHIGDAKLGIKGGPRKYTATGSFVDRGNRTLRLEATIEASRRGFVINAPKINLVVGKRSWRGSIDGLAIVHDKSFSLDRIVLASRGQRLEASGKVNFDGEDYVTATLNNFDLSVVHALVGDAFPFKKGRATANFELTGDVDRPRLTATGLLTKGELLGAKDVGANYFVAYEGGRLDLDGQLDFGQRGVMLIRGGGKLDVDERDAIAALRKADYDVEIVAEKLAFSLVPQLREAGIDGLASGTVRARGHIEEPAFSGHIVLERVEIPGTTAVRIEGELDYSHSQLHTEVDISDHHGPLGHLTLGAVLPWSLVLGEADTSMDPLAGPWSLEGHSVERPGKQLPPPLDRLFPIPVTVSTRFELERTGGPTSGWAAFEIKSAHDAEGSRCRGNVRPRVAGMATLKGAHTTFTTHITADNRRLGSARGEIYIPIDEWLDERTFSPPTQLSLRGDINIESFETLPFLCEQGRGRLTAEWRIDDALTPEPSAELTAEATFFPRTEAPLATGQTVIRSCEDDPVGLSLSLNSDRKTAKVEGRMFGCGGGATTVTGALPVSWPIDRVLMQTDPTRDVSIRLAFNHAQLRPLIDRIPGVLSGEGFADGELHLHGPADELNFDGRIKLSEGRMHIVATGQRLSGVEADIRFTRDQAQLVALHAGVDQGTLDMSGYWTFEYNVPRHAKMVMKVDEFPMRSEGVTLAWMTGAAAVEAELAEDRSRTVVKVHTLDVRLPDDAGTGLQSLQAHPDVEIISDESLKLKPRPYIMEFQIDALNGMRVHRTDMDMVLLAELAIRYADPEMRIGGYTEIQRGTFTAMGKPFKITQGSLRFDGSTRVDPEIHLSAVQQTRGTVSEAVSVRVDGRLSAPEIRFSASSCPGEAGAIALLMSGICPDEIDSGAPTGNASADLGAGLLGGIVNAGTQGQFGRIAPKVSRQGSSTSFQVGYEREAPAFIRSFVRKIYIEGGPTLGSQSNSGGNESTGRAEASDDGLDLLLQLYFPHNIVGSGKVGRGTWGLDITWEP